MIIGCSAAHANKLIGHEVFTADRKGMFAWDLETYEMAIWVRDVKDLGTMVHEAVHCANHVLMIAGVKTSQNNDEALAYLVQWIFEEMA